ncbi:hypothetical protein GGX14DRAFT_580740 [Mycena pura]|uniref:Uncharacterized protein n=1 Tax=Mycena pura TaxID=153505 RepID=A0AAD6US88_9AGAR|nr:hypothetical protein GGX14DRAFT_580740 [Mycena pura]
MDLPVITHASVKRSVTVSCAFVSNTTVGCSIAQIQNFCGAVDMIVAASLLYYLRHRKITHFQTNRIVDIIIL